MSKAGIVNIRMVITEEKILSNIDKVQKLINPNSKKQIIQLEEDAYFKDLIESIKAYLIEYPKKKNFPASVYKAAYGLVEYATTQFEENTKQIEELIRQREKNIALAGKIKNILDNVDNKETDWKAEVKEREEEFGEDIVEAFSIIARTKTNTSQNYQNAVKLINARITNLEANLHIEIDMERIEDKSKALSYIGIEVAEALKVIPAPVEMEEAVNVQAVEETPATLNNNQQITQEAQEYLEETRIEVKPSLWQRIKNSKVARAMTFLFRIKIVVDTPVLPEGKGDN